MEVVGLTGNIGSGKSTAAKAFAALGVAVFNSDEEAIAWIDDVIAQARSKFIVIGR